MTQYVIHSVVRSVHHRTHRAKAPTALRKKQYIGDTQARLVPGARMLVTEEYVQRNLHDLRQKTAECILEVRTTDGRKVDLSTMTASAPAPATKQPNFKLDSVADDKPAGQYIPPYVGDDGAMPQVLKPGEKPELLKQFVPPPSDDEEAAIDAAMADAAADDAPAPVASDAVSSGKGSKKSRR